MRVQHQTQRHAHKDRREDTPAPETAGGGDNQRAQLNDRQHKVVRGAQRLAERQLLHLVQPFKEGQRPAQYAQNSQHKTANTENKYRIFQTMHQRMQTR